MLGGNNENSLPQGFVNNNQFQYRSNTSLNQLHLLGTMRAGCATDPVNYFANDNLAPMIRHNNKPQTVINNNIKQNLVSTGLRLSHDEDKRNYSVTSANGFITTTPAFSLDFDRQKGELDQFIKFRVDEMVKGVRDIKERHVASFVTALEKDVSKKLQEKDQEIENMNKKNRELVEKIKQVAVEAQNWHYKAKYNESMVNALKVNLQEVMSHGNNNGRGVVVAHQEGFGDSEIDDEAASCNYLNAKTVKSVGVRCKSCNVKEVSVLLVPCRHLSLCKECDVFTGVCPVCQSLKTSSVQVFFS